MSASPTAFLGVDFTPLTMCDVERWVAERDARAPFAYIVTPNVDHMVKLETESPYVQGAYAGASLRLCDSVVLQRVASLCGLSLSVVRGSDLVELLFARVLQAGDRVFIVGASAGDFGIMRARYPALSFVHYDAPMGLRGDEAERARIVDAAVQASARVILLAVGFPQQEMLAFEMAQRADIHGTAFCIGASVEFLTGRQKRAPLAWRRSGMEWAWRLINNPRRMARRYLIDDPAIFGMAWRWRRDMQRLRQRQVQDAASRIG